MDRLARLCAAAGWGRVAMRGAALVVLLGLWSGWQPAFAVDRYKVLGPTVWVSGDSNLILEMPNTFHPNLRVTATGEASGSIYTTLPFSFGSSVKAIILCYQTPDTGSFITGLQLRQILVPGTTLILHTDTTDLVGAGGDCYVSPLNVTPGGSVTLSLQLVFDGDDDEIFLGALAFLVDEP